MSTEDIKEAAGRGERKKSRFISYLWDTFDKPPAERRLLTKLDTALISFGAVGENFTYFPVSHFHTDMRKGYFIKSIDQYNINNAFVSGMYVILVAILSGTIWLTAIQFQAG